MVHPNPTYTYTYTYKCNSISQVAMGSIDMFGNLYIYMRDMERYTHIHIHKHIHIGGYGSP